MGLQPLAGIPSSWSVRHFFDNWKKKKKKTRPVTAGQRRTVAPVPAQGIVAVRGWVAGCACSLLRGEGHEAGAIWLGGTGTLWWNGPDAMAAVWWTVPPGEGFAAQRHLRGAPPSHLPAPSCSCSSSQAGALAALCLALWWGLRHPSPS